MVLLLEQQNFGWDIRVVTAAAFGSYGIRKYEIKTVLRNCRFAYITTQLPCLLLCVAIRSKFIETTSNKTKLTGCR